MGKPAFHHDGVHFLLKFIAYINAYNLIFSLIFETSHFLELLMDHNQIEQAQQALDEHSNQSYFLVSFSTSFAIAHSNLWFLSQFWEWTQKKSNRFKMSESKYPTMMKDAIPLETPAQFGGHDKQIHIVRREQYDTFAAY